MNACHHSNLIHMKSKCIMLLKCSYNDQIFFYVTTVAYTPGVLAPVFAITLPAISFIIDINEM